MEKMTAVELKCEARKRKIRGFSKMKKAELLVALGAPKKEKPAAKPAAKPVGKSQDSRDGLFYQSFQQV